MDWEDTIVAAASAVGDGCRGVVRLLGPKSHEIVRIALEPSPTEIWSAPSSWKGDFCIAQWLRRCSVHLLIWPAGRSATGQAAVEIHTYAGDALASAIVSQCCKAGARLARPGEFTLRMFLAGRLDLAQAESVFGLIEARDARELAFAVDERGGGLSRPVHALRSRLLDLLADVEASLDFVEEDIQFIHAEELSARLAGCLAELKGLAEQYSGRRQAGIRKRVVLLGPPNAGKSTLFNLILGRSAALVDSTAGTTRDFLSASIPLGGSWVDLFDTAGIDASDHYWYPQAEAGREAATGSADLEIHCLRAGEPEPVDWAKSRRRLLVRTQLDRVPTFLDPSADCQISATGPPGWSSLVTALEVRLGEMSRETNRADLSLRCWQGLIDAIGLLTETLAEQRTGAGMECTAVGLRETLNALGEIVGTVHTNDLLDRIFSRFCIGK